MNFKLYGYTICPYVHRVLITLSFKKIPFEVEYIERGVKPNWFLQISPTAKVPVLVVDGKHSLFESNIINMFLDEVSVPTLDSDPVTRAKERAYMEYAGKFISALYEITIEKNPNVALQKVDSTFTSCQHLEHIIGENGYFKGNSFSIIDSAYAPFFHRLSVLQLFEKSMLAQLPKLSKWYQSIIAEPATIQSLPASFLKDYEALRNGG